MLNFNHSGRLGDLVYSLAAVRQLALRSGKPANLYTCLDTWQQLKPLLELQPYIHNLDIRRNQRIDVELDVFRRVVDLGRGSIARWYFHCLPEASCDLSLPWLECTASDKFEGKILVARTARYRNRTFDYRCLAGRTDVAFVGLAEDYSDFGLNMPWYTAQDHLELAGWVKGCRLLVSNQNFIFSLAEAMKTPRLLEVYPAAPNVIPCGPNGWDCYQGRHLADMIKLILRT